MLVLPVHKVLVVTLLLLALRRHLHRPPVECLSTW